MNKKDMIIVALATFCLTSTLFMILPSRSAERDPWADISGPIQGEPDGTINMRDINYEIQHFNQDVSNMTRNVNVTNWPTATTVSGRFNITWYGFGAYGYTIYPDLAHFTTTGYSRMTIQLSIVDWYPQPTDFYFTNLTAYGAIWTIKPNAYTYPLAPLSDNATVTWSMSFPGLSSYGMTSKTTEIIGPQFSLEFQVESQIEQGSVLFDVYVYMRNE